MSEGSGIPHTNIIVVRNSTTFGRLLSSLTFTDVCNAQADTLKHVCLQSQANHDAGRQFGVVHFFVRGEGERDIAFSKLQLLPVAWWLDLWVKTRRVLLFFFFRGGVCRELFVVSGLRAQAG